jgi:hypothetical protein
VQQVAVKPGASVLWQVDRHPGVVAWQLGKGRVVAVPRLISGNTGMHWRRKDRPLIRDIHRRLDQHWADKYGPEE